MSPKGKEFPMTTLRDEDATHEVAPSTAPPAETPTPAPAHKPKAGEAADVKGEQPQVVEEVIVEEVSIDGMCGVY